MDKLKNLLKSDTPTDDSSSSPGLSGKVSGQGSHFASREAKDAAYTQGPESGGSGHVGTTSAGQGTSDSTYTSNQPSSYEASSFPGQGTAAIGQTTTYSSSQLGKGDPTSSVIDHESKDPLTYKKPESSVADTGVPAGSAMTAATRAFNEQGQERSSAGHENPYKTSHLDPRVDGGAKAAAPHTSTQTSSTGRDTGLAGSSGVGSLGAASGLSESRQHAHTAAAPSTLTTTVDPAERSAEYGSSTTSRGLDQASTLPTTSSTTGTTSTTHPTTETATDSSATQDQPSMVGRALGAVGLGSVAGAFGYGATEAHRDSGSALEDTPSQPTTTTGISSYTAPTTQTGTGQTGIGHHRKESIPTTAYPGGLNSPPAINAPVGGTRPSVDETSHSGVSRSAAGVGGAAALGGAAIGAHEYQQSKSSAVPSSMQEISGPTFAHNATTSPTGPTGFASASAPTGPYVVGTSAAGPTATTTAEPSYGTTQFGKHTGTSATGPTAATTAESSYGTTQFGKHTETPLTSTGKHTETPLREDHTARNVALGAGGATSVEEAVAYNKQKDLEKEEKHRQKEIEKEQKHHQKELEKEQKHHQKEVEKAEKKHEKEVAAREHEQQKQMDREAEERERIKRDLAAGAAGGAAGGAIASHHKSDDTAQTKSGLSAAEPEKERKPSLFRRIFKKRQNKDTGLEEEYSSDEDDTKHTRQHGEGGLYGTHGTAAATGTAAAAGTGAAVAHERSTEPTATSQTYNKPSYNPLSHDQPSTQPISSTTGTGTGVTSSTAHPHTSTTGSQPRESITGLPYDPSKDPETAARLSQHQHGSGMGATGTSTGFDPIAAGSFKMGEITDKEHDAGAGHAPVGQGVSDTGISSNTGSLDRGYGHGHAGSSAVAGTGAAVAHEEVKHTRQHEEGGLYGTHNTGTTAGAATGTSATGHGTGVGSETGQLTGNTHTGNSTLQWLDTADEYGTGTGAKRGSVSGAGTTAGLGTQGPLADESIASTKVDPSGHVQDQSVGTKVKESFKLGGL